MLTVTGMISSENWVFAQGGECNPCNNSTTSINSTTIKYRDRPALVENLITPEDMSDLSHLSDEPRTARNITIGSWEQGELMKERKQALRTAINRWGNRRRAAGYSDASSYEVFRALLGVDVVKAQTLSYEQMGQLIQRLIG